MNAYRIPRRIRAFLFDIDGTLYTNREYGLFQVDVLVDELARLPGQSRTAVEASVAAARKAPSARSGSGTSLGNAMAALGVDIATSVEWRRRLIDPNRFLSPDPRLRETLSTLAGGAAGEPAAIVAVTNNPRSVGEATLEVLGVADLFVRVVGLDDTMKSKPATEPWILAALSADCGHADCIAVGDRFDVDLADPLELGMGAILVDGVEDVYRLPGILGYRPG